MRRARLAAAGWLVLSLAPPLSAQQVAVHGTVTEYASSTAIPGASISIESFSWPAGYLVVGTATSDAAGSYAWSGDCEMWTLLPCRVRAVAPDYALAESTFNPYETPDVQADLSLHRAAFVSGTVRIAADGSSLAGVQVVLRCIPEDQACLYAGYAITDVEGHYSLDGLAGGTYSLCAEPSQESGLVPQCFDHADAGHDVLVLADGEHRTGVDFAFHPGGTVSGMVVDGYLHQPVANASLTISLRAADGTPLTQTYAHTDSNGQYVGEHVPAGTYHVVLTAGRSFDPTAYPDLPCAEGCDVTSSPAVEVTDNATVDGLDFIVQPRAIISGHVREAGSGVPIGDIPIAYGYCLPLGGCLTIDRTISAADGSYALFLPDNDLLRVYTANLRPWIDQAWPTTPCMGESACAQASDDVTLGHGEHRVAEVALVRGASIAGHVEDTVPGANATAFIFVKDATMQTIFGTYADDEGNYETPAWYAGTWFAKAVIDHACQFYQGVRCPDADENEPPAPTPIQLVVGEHHTGIDFALDSADPIFRDGF